MLKRRGQSTAHKHTGDHIRSQDRACCDQPVSCLCIPGAPGHTWLCSSGLDSGDAVCCSPAAAAPGPHEGRCPGAMPHAGPLLTNLVATDLFQVGPTLLHRQALWPALPGAKPSPVAGAQRERGPRASRADQWPELSLSPCRTHSQGRSQHSTRESRPETPRGLTFFFH